ncbi:MAG: metal ABC transporter permease [Ignavibacteria bacterium]|nr:metal ABC transporter permease [Ignavibacteria bacterium]
MIETLTNIFVLRGILSGIILGFLGGYYGSFIVQRRMSFLGDGLAHVAFGGIALGLLLEKEPLWIALPFTILVAIALTFLKEKSELEIDTAIGIFFAISVALGILFISLNKHYISDAFSYLFGSILLVSEMNLLFSSFVTILTIILTPILWKRWTYTSFDRELAITDKINVSVDNYILSILIALTIVTSIKLVGIFLVASFLVIPSASAKLISKTFTQLTLFGIIFGVLSSIFGIFFSISLDVPTGSTIILTQALIFLFCLIIKNFNFKRKNSHNVQTR